MRQSPAVAEPLRKLLASLLRETGETIEDTARWRKLMAKSQLGPARRSFPPTLAGPARHDSWDAAQSCCA